METVRSLESAVYVDTTCGHTSIYVCNPDHAERRRSLLAQLAAAQCKAKLRKLREPG